MGGRGQPRGRVHGLDQGVAAGQVREELIPPASTLVRTRDQPRDIDDSHRDEPPVSGAGARVGNADAAPSRVVVRIWLQSSGRLLASAQLGAGAGRGERQPSHPDVWLDGRERVIGDIDRCLRQRGERGRLAHVRLADQPYSHGIPPE